MEQVDLLRFAVRILEARSIPYMLVGSLASSVYGEPRFTNDIDIVIELTPAQIQPLCDAFPSPEFYVSIRAATEAVQLRRQFNVIHPTSGNKIDFMIARGDAWGRSELARRREETIVPGLQGYVAAPEDVILAKLVYYQEGEHEKHLRDIASMLRISSADIDRHYITQWAEQLGLGGPWRIVLERVDRN